MTRRATYAYRDTSTGRSAVAAARFARASETRYRALLAALPAAAILLAAAMVMSRLLAA